MLGLGLGGLILVVAGHFALARALCRWAGETRLAVAAALALALLYALPATVTRVLPAFVPAASIAAALAASAAFLVTRVARPPEATTTAEPPSWSRPALVGAFLTLVLVVWATVATRLWDETNAHFGLVRVVARGLVPPPHPLFPQEPFRYHYGFDVLGALPQAFLGLRTDHAIDVATLACWLVLVAMARTVGAALGGARGANLATVLVPLGSGLLTVFLFQDFYLLGPRWDALPIAWATSMPPPAISNFFQHPQGLGMSLGLAVALLIGSGPDPLRRRKLVVGALLLGMLSLGQIVFFGICGLLAGVVVLVHAVRTRDLGGLLVEAALLLGALAIAAGLGGFLTPGAQAADVMILGKTYFGEPLGRSLVHHLVVFGLPLVALPLALWARRRELTELRVFLFGAAILGLLVPNVVGYERSWDIVKFFGVGAFFANAALVDWTLTLRRHPLVTAAVVVLAVPASVVWLLRMSVFNGILGVHPMQFGPPTPIAVATTAVLDPLVGPHERVLSTNMDMAMTGGFLTPGFRWREHGESYLMDRVEADRLTSHLESARHSLRRADLEALRVRWVVLSAGDVASLHAEGMRALADTTLLRKVDDVRVGGEIRHVYEVLPAPSAPTPSPTAPTPPAP